MRKVMGKPQCLRNAPRFILNFVGKFTSKFLATPQKSNNISHMFNTGNNENISNSCGSKFFNRMINHRLAGYRQEGFVCNFSQRIKPTPRPPSQNNPSYFFRFSRHFKTPLTPSPSGRGLFLANFQNTCNWVRAKSPESLFAPL